MKGGVGKTTTVVSLAETFAAEGRSVLVIDVDTQANASYCLAGDAILAELIHNDRTIDEFFRKRLVDNLPCPIKPFVRPQVSHVTHLGRQLNVSLLASSLYLRLTEREIIHTLTSKKYSMSAIEGQAAHVLGPGIKEFRDHYDFIIFDCAPGISAFTTAAILLCDLIMIPTIPDFLSYLGLSAFVENILSDTEKGKRQNNAHVLITRKNNTNHHKDYHRRIIDLSEEPESKFSVLKTSIPETSNFPQAMQMIDNEHPTYTQKYKQISAVLSDLADEVTGAFA